MKPFNKVLQACLRKDTTLRDWKLVSSHFCYTRRKVACFLTTIASISTSAIASAPNMELLGQKEVECERNEDNCYCVNVGTLCKTGRFDEALKIFHHMNQKDISIDSATYTCLLEGCTSLMALEEGRRVHANMTRAGFEPDLFQRNCLINMYVKCGSLEDARNVFDEMPERNVVSWSATMTGYVQHGCGKEAIELFRQMQTTSVKPTHFTFGSALRACAMLGVGALEWGKQVHGDIVKVGLQSHDVLNNVLIEMYAKCGYMVYASRVFDKLPERKSISWNAMISVCVQHGCNDDALKLFCQMQRLDMKPSQFTFASVITACANLSAKEQGKQVHILVIKTGYISDIFVGSALVNMYAKCGSPDNARRLFDRMPDRNVVSWTAMMVGYVQHNCGEDAIQLYNEMRLAGINLNQNSFAIALSACASIDSLELGTRIHAHTVKTGYELDVSVGNGLVNMYAKCGSIEGACRVFKLMPKLDLISWNAIISGYTHNGHCKEALKHFNLMQQAGLKSDAVTVASVLSSAVSLEALKLGKQIHADIFKTGLELDVSVGNSLITFYAKSGNIAYSRQVFDRMPEQDMISWNAMIGGYAQNELTSEAIELFQRMQKIYMQMNNVTFVSILGALTCPETLDYGKQVHAHMIISGLELDVCLENALVAVYAKAGRMFEASNLFNKMKKQDAVTWNSMIAGYTFNGHGEDALKLVCKMQEERMKLDHFTFATVLRACASIASLEHGKQAHASIIRARFESDIVVASALVDMYAKCGSIEDAHHVFDKMTKRNDISWNAMISGYARHGHGEEALQLFDQMQLEGLKPGHITFVGVLSACSHAGLVDKGRNYFDSMSLIHGVTPKVEHYACIVDLLGRAGCLAEAEDFIHKMPIKPTPFIWRTLLGACRVYGNMEIGKRAADCLLESEPQDAASYVLLSNIYASAGKWDDAVKVRTMMKERGVKKDPGYSWIKLKNEVHAFLVGDTSHPQTQEIYAKLACLTEKMKVMGYIPDINFVLHDVEQEQKEHFLSYHSEKLAIAFGIIRTPAGTPIRIIKNLRVCGDCHSAIKFISQIVGRKIVVRDSNRYHHFMDGLCSCGDYW